MRYSLAYKLGRELAEDSRGAVRPPGLAVAVGERWGGGASGVGGALLVPGPPLLPRVERAADAHPSGEVGPVRHGRAAADVVGGWGGAGRPLRRSAAGGEREGEEKGGKRRGARRRNGW